VEHRKTQVWADSTLCWVVEQRESEEHSSEISRLLLEFSRKVFWEVGGHLTSHVGFASAGVNGR